MEESKIARFVIEFDPAKNVCRTIIEGQFPVPNLVNMLEIEKQKLIMGQISQMVQQAQQQPRIVAPGGMPLPNFRGT